MRACPTPTTFSLDRVAVPITTRWRRCNSDQSGNGCASIFRCFLWVPNFLAPGTSFVEDNFFTAPGQGTVWGRFKCIRSIVRCISIITSAPPQLIRPKIMEVGDCCKKQDSSWIKTPAGLSSLKTGKLGTACTRNFLTLPQHHWNTNWVF